MPQLNGNQFREFSVERSVAARNEADPFSHARGYQNYSSNLYAPSFSEDYNRPPAPNHSPSAGEQEEEED